jgi:RNA polymerase sigma-70 factor (ECF subfamily)
VYSVLKKIGEMTENEKKQKFMELFAPLHKRLERFAMVTCRDVHTAKDVTSETIRIAYEQFDKLRDEQAFLGYLFTIAKRVSTNYLKKRLRTPVMDLELIDELASHSIQPDTSTELRLIFDAIDRLKPELRRAFMLFEVSGLSEKEIADIEGISHGNARIRIHRAKNQLKEMLGVKSPKVQQ